MAIDIEDILTPDRTKASVQASSKKKLLELLANLIAEQVPETTHDEVFDRLLERERLGSTGLGEGIAIPHCRLKHCPEAIGVLFSLSEQIDYDSMDKQPVDLVFALLVPEEATDEHLQILSRLAGNFSQVGYRQRLRQAQTDDELFRQACRSN